MSAFENGPSEIDRAANFCFPPILLYGEQRRNRENAHSDGVSRLWCHSGLAGTSRGSVPLCAKRPAGCSEGASGFAPFGPCGEHAMEGVRGRRARSPLPGAGGVGGVQNDDPARRRRRGCWDGRQSQPLSAQEPAGVSRGGRAGLPLYGGSWAAPRRTAARTGDAIPRGHKAPECALFSE